jgi:transcriptional regulator with XRE-family HTH domain
MVLTHGRAAAAEYAAQAAARAGLSAAAVAQRANVDPGTVRDFLAGERWPWTSSRARIEKALDLKPGVLELIANGVQLDPDADPVEEAIKASELTRGNQHKLIGVYFDMLEEQQHRGTG